MSAPSIGISIATRNRWADVEKTLSKIAMRPELGGCPVIVVDDGSAQPAPPGLVERHPGVEFWSSGRSLGASAQRTRIAQLMKTDFILQLDDDSYPVEGSVSDAVSFMEARPDIAALALNVAMGEMPSPLIDRDEAPYEVDLFIGCGVLFRRELFLSLGGFFSALGYYFEEHHFCAHAFREGRPVYIFPSLVVRHEKSLHARSTARIAYYKGRNRVLLALWHYPLRVVPLRLATSLPGTLALVRLRDYPAAFAGFAAGLFDGIRMLDQRRPLSYSRYRQWRALPSCYKPARRPAARPLVRGGALLTLAVLALAGPARADDAQARPVYGVMTHFAQGWDPSLAGPAAGAGIRDVRDEIYWQDVEPERGRFVFPGRYERYMAELRARGISPLIELTFANRAYDGGMTPYTEEGFEAYARYGVELLRHYGGQISAVELWNEYNGSFCKGPASRDRAATYACMARVAYRALKEERPDLVVAGGATAGVPLPYLERLFAEGALDSMDAVSVHPYRYDSEPEGIEDDIAGLQDLIRRYSHGRPKPVWVTEIGWGTGPAAAPLGLAIDERTQASFLVRAYALLVSAGVERIYWYLLRDYDRFATMGLLRGDALDSPKPAFRAMQEMISETGDARFVRREQTPGDLYSILFRSGSGGQVRVVWSLRPRPLALPASCRAFGMLGGPLAPGAALTIGGEPVFIEGPLTGLPSQDPNAPRIFADSARDFSEEQGRRGWSYGVFVGDSAEFVQLRDFRTTDWKREWFAAYPFLSLTDRDQHPSESAAGPVAAVRRWRSERGGRVRIIARFHCGAKGDGVRVKVLVGGREAFSRAIGGANPAEARFDSAEDVPAGDAVDFAVYPGPRGNANFDATELSAAIAGQD
jgi:GT2 family glycosyltransferase